MLFRFRRKTTRRFSGSRADRRRPPGYRPRLEMFEPRTMLSAGSLDPTFGTGGKVMTDLGGFDEASSVAIQPADDKIVVAGVTDAGNGLGPDFALARYNPNGALDASFNFDGKATTDFFGETDVPYAVAVQSDGKIVAAGEAHRSGVDDFALARYNADGSLDLGFGTGGKVVTPFRFGDASIRSMTILDDGKILVAGYAGSDMALARYLPDGSLDPTFGAGGEALAFFSADSVAQKLAVQKTDGKFVVAGRVGNELAVVRFDANGALDPSFGTQGHVVEPIVPDALGTAVAVQNDGNIVVAGASFGNSANDTSSFIARFLPDGSPDPNFNAGGKVIFSQGNPSFLSDLAIQQDGRIVAVGNDIGISGFSVVRRLPDGSPDPDFGNGGLVSTPFGAGGAASALALQADGKLVVAGGKFLANDTDFAVARYDAAFSTLQVSVVGNQLSILGSRFADQIDVTLDARGVTVASLRERTAPLTISGISRVVVDTGAGDDTLSLHLEPIPDGDFQIRADLGAGDDAFNAVLVPPGPCMPGETPGALGITVEGGAGNDTFNTVMVPPGPCMPVQVSLDGGAGDDRITTAFLGDAEPIPDGDRPAPVDLNVQGGAGRDDIRVIFGFNPQPDPPALPSVFLNTPVRAQLNGGRGDDDIRVIYGFNPQPDPPAKLFIDAPMDIAADGGRGDDDIRVIFGFNPQPDPPAIPSVVVNAPVSLTLDGGGGDDFLLGDLLSLDIRGGALDATLDGGAGDDVLALQVLGALPATLADLVVDGGSGFDVALASAGVNVIDCEAIISTIRGL